jgi:glycosyltransferase involved in cell wall biosynthesis
MEKKKILYIVTLAERGGAQKYVIDLAENLKDRYDILVAAHGKDSDWLFKRLKEKGINQKKLYNLKRQISPINDIAAIFEIKKLIQKFKPDIIHLNSSKAGVIGSIAARKNKAKVIYTAHGFVFNEPLNIVKKNIYLWAERLTGKYKDDIITISDFDKKTGIKHIIAPTKKFTTIYTGIKPDSTNILTRDKARSNLGVPEKYNLVGTISNYYSTKALHRLIKAASLVIKKCSDCKFILIGEGPEKDKLETLIKKLNLTNNFFLGPVENALIYLKALDVFVLPSVKEGMPYTILEAMLAEVPIIATEVGGIPEMIEDGQQGFTVETHKRDEEEIIKELAEKIEYYLGNPNIIEVFTNKAHRKLLNNFTLEKMIQETEKVYNK